MTAVLESTTTGRQAARPRALLLALLCALLAAATYACSLRGIYLLDDEYSVSQDPRVTTGQWKELWTQPYRAQCFDRLYRPLVCTSFAVQWRLHGDRPWLFHLVNILLHAAVTWVLVLLVWRISGEGPAVIAGLLFAVLPIHTEAVVNIVGRAECMCALGTLYGLYAFITRPLSGRLMLTLAGCFLFAAFSKEQGILFPLLLLAAVPLRSKQGLPPATPMTRRLFVALFLWLPAGYLVFREWMVPMWWDRSVMYWDSNPIIRAHGLDRVLLPIVVFAHYVQLTVAPRVLSFDYSGMVIGWHVSLKDPYLYLGLACLLALALAMVWSVRRKRWAAFLAICGLALTYGLVSNSLVVIGTLMGERLAYVPSAFFLMLIAGPLARLYRPALVLGIAAVVAIYGLRSVTYGVRWNDEKVFFTRSLEDQPRGRFVYGSMYVYYCKRGEWETALDIAKRLRAFMPDSADAHYMCIRAEIALGRFAEAKRSAEFGEAQPILDVDKVPMKQMWCQADELQKEQRSAATVPSTQPAQ